MRPIMTIDPDGPQGNIFYIWGLATGRLISCGAPASVRDEMSGRVRDARTPGVRVPGLLRSFIT